MKNYFKGILMLGLILTVIFSIGIKSYKASIHTKNILRGMQEKRANSPTSNELQQQELLVNSHIIKTLNEFSQSWEKLLSRHDPNKILSDLVELSFENTVAVSEKSAQCLQTSDQGIQKESILVSLKVVGKFERIYAWLGAIEEAYPQAKISELDLMAESMNAALTLKLQIPKVS
jgi:hypothetical protein